MSGREDRALKAALQRPRAGRPIDTPVLFGQSREYFTGPMLAFKNREGQNDVYDACDLSPATDHYGTVSARRTFSIVAAGSL
ncbi:MAG: hypothetical protein K2Y29_12515 [Beijerinckiaceae bacterium]|nr:hypothetical protein [Beijerinckiaceae bacterium]